MDISDCVNGSAYIKLYRSDFKDSYAFDSYCRFLRCSTKVDALKVYVIHGEPESEINENDPDEPNEFEEVD